VQVLGMKIEMIVRCKLIVERMSCAGSGNARSCDNTIYMQGFCKTEKNERRLSK
jgi:hypothetical protein